MNGQKLSYFEKVDHPKQREFIQAHNQCVLCHTELELRHVVDSGEFQIKEEAYCPECEVRTRAKIHNLN